MKNFFYQEAFAPPSSAAQNMKNPSNAAVGNAAAA
jgi:hypothetical protein